jgi:hypothetical protein
LLQGVFVLALALTTGLCPKEKECVVRRILAAGDALSHVMFGRKVF